MGRNDPDSLVVPKYSANHMSVLCAISFNQNCKMLSCTSTFVLLFLFIFLFFVVPGGLGTKTDDKKDKKTDEKDKWKKKDIRDYNDADLERLFDQWEVGFKS